MINLVLATFVFALAIASEVLLWIEQTRQAKLVGSRLQETSVGLTRRVIRPVIAGVLVWLVSSHVEKASIAKPTTPESAQFSNVDREL